jgi:uncharacterized GH25 family protein
LLADVLEVFPRKDNRMRRDSQLTRTLLLVAALVLSAGSLAAHDLFLKLATYFLPPDTAVSALLLNGTFTKSENAVARDRFADLTLVGPGGRNTLDTTALSAQGDTTRLRFRTGAAGTYVVGLSVRPREIALTGEQFNGYLKEEGIDEMLSERTRTGALGEAAKERYAKHVKAILQVGETRSEQYATVLGYTAEIVPLENPYGVRRGGSLRFRCLVGGKPMEGLMLLAGGLTPAGREIPESRGRTDADGVARVQLSSAGRWYVKFIRMRHAPELGSGITHESQWATLTFEVR